MAHRNANLSLGELITQISAIALERLRERRSGGRGRTTQSIGAATTAAQVSRATPIPATPRSTTSTPLAPKTKSTSGAKTNPSTRVLKSSVDTAVPEVASIDVVAAAIGLKESKPSKKLSLPAFPLRTRYIPAALRRIVFNRDGLACTYQDPISGRRCGSRFALELDHRIPFAKGGPHSEENLTARCRAHNQWAALRAFGLKKMVHYGRRRNEPERPRQTKEDRQ